MATRKRSARRELSFVPLDVAASIGTYKIDSLVTAHPSLSYVPYPAHVCERFREAFNSHAHSANSADTNLVQFKDSLSITIKMINDLSNIRELIRKHNSDGEIERLLVKAPPDIIFVDEYGQDDEHDPRRDVDHVAGALEDLSQAIDHLLKTCVLSDYCVGRKPADPFTHDFVKWLAVTPSLWPFTPVTNENWKAFAELLAAAWDDLRLAVPPEVKYESTYLWLRDRVRTQLGFKP